jgi:hypothetical protein
VKKKKVKKKRVVPQPVRIRRLLKKCHEVWSAAVRGRDGMCVRCGKKPPDVQLSAHHWLVSSARSRRYRFDVRNGVSLCYGCHIRCVHTEASLGVIWDLLEKVDFIGKNEAISVAMKTRGEENEKFKEAELEETLRRLLSMRENPAKTGYAAKQEEVENGSYTPSVGIQGGSGEQLAGTDAAAEEAGQLGAGEV